MTLTVAPDHPQFREYYYAARKGIQLPAPEETKASSIRGSVGWLVELYAAAMDGMVKDGAMAEATQHQRGVFLDWLRAEVGEYKALMPQCELVKLRDKKTATPGAADNFIKAVRAMYSWGCDRGHVSANPATGIAKLNRDGKGATAWTVADLKQYREKHPPGTMAHLALTLFMFTACRISDVVLLGRGNEIQRKGVTWLDFQPVKKGAKRVRIPMLPPLFAATRASTIVGKTYLLTAHGRPFASSTAFDNRFRSWVISAGFVDDDGKATRSSHGIRKAAGELLALEGASQYQIMAVHGHASPKTSQIYTDGVDRDELAAVAMSLLSGMDW
ncbi:tyrosine-type recombinase/integrase [Paenirhodobacter populi]|uniref:tyrosine-type recombinase/integrase n=1 Tax=Paenirhodobacter populi TaxID=2306993 RepID=UPI0013E37198|nr:tyrosine-type recombinase/integrase [Sinirhodobacter populi]